MKKINLLLLTLILGGTIMGCSSSRYRKVSAYNSSFPGTGAVHRGGQPLADKGNSFKNVETIERKILFSAFLSLTVAKPDTANLYIQKIAKKYNGYVSELGTYQTIIRVKSEDLDIAIAEISKLGKVQHKNVKGEDVTEEYMDYEIRLENAEKSRERYLELLAKAENVEAALKVEKELERLNETIDLLKGKMNKIDHLAEFSTLTISLTEKKKPGLLGYIGIGIYRSVKWLFVRN